MPYLDAPTSPGGDGRLARIRTVLAADRQRYGAQSPASGLAEGPGVAAALEPVGPGGFHDEQLDAYGDRVLSQIEGLERAKARLESQLLEAYAALHTIQSQQLDRLASTTPVPTHPDRVVAAEIACATGVGTGEVSRRLELALAPRRHRVLCEALRQGRVSLYRALTVVAQTRALPDDQLLELETTVLAPAPDGTVASQRLFAARLRRCVTAADARGSDERRLAATRRRGVFGRLTEDGMGVITLTAAAERVVGVLDRVEVLARAARSAGDQRTLDQLRSDLLTDLALFATVPSPTAPSPTVPSPTVTAPAANGLGAGLTCGPWLAAAPAAVVRIVVPFEVATGESQAACELPGHGWVTAAHARAIMTAPGSLWQHLPVDVHTGTALPLSTERYTPTRAMVEHVRALDGVCRAPGCQVPAERCDLDHLTPWPAGPTTVANLQALSRGCHHRKTLGAWRARRDPGPDSADPGGAVHWSTLAGRDYVTYPRNWREALADPGVGPPHRAAPEPEPPPF